MKIELLKYPSDDDRMFAKRCVVVTVEKEPEEVEL